MEYDLIISGGRVIDGTGAAAIQSNPQSVSIAALEIGCRGDGDS